MSRAQGTGRCGRAAAGVVAACLLLGSAAGARANEGIGGFFQQLFGGPAAPGLVPQPGEGGDGPPLTVRGHKHRRPSGGQRAKRYTPDELKAVTMYTDRTLVRGDAVMTARGVRIFNGSSSWPYTDDDFSALSTVGKMPKALRAELTVIDDAAQSDYRGR